MCVCCASFVLNLVYFRFVLNFYFGCARSSNLVAFSFFICFFHFLSLFLFSLSFLFTLFFYRESVAGISLVLTIQIKATEQCYSVVLHAYFAEQGAANFQVCG